MATEYTQQLYKWSPAKVVAQAYGSDAYGGNSYNGRTTTSTAPQAPSTGFFPEQPLVTIPLLLVAAIILGTITYTLSRIFRRRRSRKQS